MLQRVSDNVLELVKTNGDIRAKIGVMNEKITSLEIKQTDLERTNRQIVGMLGLKMEPEKCAHMHSQVEKRIMDNLRKGAQGWGRRAFTVLKIAAWLSLFLGGSATFAQAFGLLKILK